MKKLIIATLSIISVCIAVNFAVLSAKSDEEPATGNSTYIIKNYEGKVSCFEKESESPFMITEIYVINLPPADRKFLQNGVEVVGAKELSKVLEDYRT